MAYFSFSKVDNYRNTRNPKEDIIDIKFPSELDPPIKEEMLVFIIDDDPRFLEILNTHFSKLQLATPTGHPLKFKVRNFATGQSAIVNLNLKPDIILLNYFINRGLPNALTGKETLEQINEVDPDQKVIVLNDLKVDISKAFVENGLRDYIIKDHAALDGLNVLLREVLMGR